jgi:hypothetical protein
LTERGIELDPETCFAHIEGEDAYFDMTLCDARVQQRCLRKNNLEVPAVPQVLLAEKYSVQALVTKPISTHRDYAPMAVDVLAEIQKTLERYFPKALFILKGSAAMRLMLYPTMEYPDLFRGELKRLFADYVQNSDLDSMIILDPSGLTRTEYQHQVEAVMESIFHTMLTFIETRNTGYQRAIRSMLEGLPGTDESGTLSLQPTRRSSLQILEDYSTDPAVFIRGFFTAASYWVTPHRKGVYRLPVAPGAPRLTEGSDQVFFAPDYVPHTITKATSTTLEFTGLTPLRDFPVGVTLLVDTVEVHLTGYLTEAAGHQRNIQLELREDYAEEFGDYLVPNAVLELGGDRNTRPPSWNWAPKEGSAGTEVAITKVLGRKKHPAVVRVEVDTRIFPRAIGGYRQRQTLTKKYGMYTSYQKSIQIKETEADFALLRVLFPVSVGKGRHSAFSKVELVDISIPNHEDINMRKNWEKYFQPSRRDSWLSFVCHRGFRAHDAICMRSVNLQYQTQDLLRMQLENTGGGKSEKRRMRSRLITEVNRFLGLGGRGNTIPRLKKILGEGWSQPPRVQLNHASATLLCNVLEAEDFPTGEFTNQDWAALKPVVEHHQSSSLGLLSILAHLNTVRTMKINPDYRKNRAAPLPPDRLDHLTDLYRYFGHGATF